MSKSVLSLVKMAHLRCSKSVAIFHFVHNRTEWFLAIQFVYDIPEMLPHVRFGLPKSKGHPLFVLAKVIRGMELFLDSIRGGRVSGKPLILIILGVLHSLKKNIPVTKKPGQEANVGTVAERVFRPFGHGVL